MTAVLSPTPSSLVVLYASVPNFRIVAKGGLGERGREGKGSFFQFIITFTSAASGVGVDRRLGGCSVDTLVANLAGYTLLNRTLPNQNLLYRNQVNRTLLNQETAKPYLAKPDSAKQEYGKSPFWNLLNHTLLNRNLIKQETGIC